MFSLGGKPDTFVMMVAMMSEKLVEKETELGELRAHLAMHHADMEADADLITTLREEHTNLRVQNENLIDANNRQRRTIAELEGKVRDVEWIRPEYERMKQELLTLKYGGEKDPHKRAEVYMTREGGKTWASGNKIECIKCVRECTGWGLKETKDWCEQNADKYLPKPPSLDKEEGSGPHTKRSSQVPQGVGIEAKRVSVG